MSTPKPTNSKILRDSLAQIRNAKVLQDKELDSWLSALFGEMQDLRGELAACKTQLIQQQKQLEAHEVIIYGLNDLKKNSSGDENNKKLLVLQKDYEELEKKLEEEKSNKQASPPPQKQQYLTTNGIQIPLTHFQNESGLEAEVTRTPLQNAATQSTMTNQSVPATSPKGKAPPQQLQAFVTINGEKVPLAHFKNEEHFSADKTQQNKLLQPDFLLNQTPSNPPSYNFEKATPPPDPKQPRVILQKFLQDPQAAITEYNPIALVVPIDNQNARRNNPEVEVQLEPRTFHNQANYLAFETHNSKYVVLPRLDFNFQVSFLQQLGLDYLYELANRPAGNSGMVKQIDVPAIMTQERGRWHLITKGSCEF